MVRLGLTTAYGNTTAVQNAGSGTTSVTINASLTGLEPGKTYHYRMAGQNSAGTTYGEDRTFTTHTSSPVYGYDKDGNNYWSKDEAVSAVTDYLVYGKIERKVALGIVTGYLLGWTVEDTAAWVDSQ